MKYYVFYPDKPDSGTKLEAADERAAAAQFFAQHPRSYDLLISVVPRGMFSTVVQFRTLEFMDDRTRQSVRERPSPSEQQAGPLPDDPNVAAKPAPFWIIALGAASIAFVAGFWAIVHTLGENPETHQPSKLVLPLFMLLAGGLVFGHFSRRRLWLVSLFLIVPNPMFFLPLALTIGSLGDPPGSHGSFEAYALIVIGAFIAAPLIGVGLAALTRFHRPGPPDPGKPVKTAIVVAIIGVIISAVIALIFNFGLVAFDAASAPMVEALSAISTISEAGGFLFFFFALLTRWPWPPDPGKLMKAAIVVAIIGVIISAVISLILTLGLVPLDAASAPMVEVLSVISTISEAGGFLFFFFALLMRWPWPPDPGKLMKAAIVVAIIGVIISAVISLILTLGLHPLDAGQALFLTSTISQAGGFLIFFFALLLRQK